MCAGFDGLAGGCRGAFLDPAHQVIEGLNDVRIEFHARRGYVLKRHHAIVIARHVPHAVDLIETMQVPRPHAIGIGAQFANHEVVPRAGNFNRRNADMAGDGFDRGWRSRGCGHRTRARVRP